MKLKKEYQVHVLAYRGADTLNFYYDPGCLTEWLGKKPAKRRVQFAKDEFDKSGIINFRGLDYVIGSTELQVRESVTTDWRAA